MMARYFDTHAHYDDKRFDGDREALIMSLAEHNIDLVVNPGSSMRSSRAAVELSERHPFFYGAVGVHPHDAKELTENGVSELKRMTKHPKVVAVGEIGLDYHYDFSPRDIQKRGFERQLQLAVDTGMPVIIHDREAHADTLDILKNFKLKAVVYHCYSGSLEYAKVLLGRGYYLSFTGAVTFKGAYRSHEVIRYMPIDRLMLETDAPYLAPAPHRGKRCDSTFLPAIARAISDIRGIAPEELAETTYHTGREFFGI